MTTPKTPARDDGARLARRLADLLNETGLTEIEIEHQGLRVRVARSPATQTFLAPPPAGPALIVPSAPAATAPAMAAAAIPAEGEVVTSPMVGTVYLQAQPGAPPFVKAGDAVTAGQTLLLIEAMKTMNPIPAPRAGTVLEIMVADSQPVEYGEPLIVLA